MRAAAAASKNKRRVFLCVGIITLHELGEVNDRKDFFCSCNCGAGTHCGVIYRLWTKKCKVVCRSVLDRFLLHFGLVGMVLDIFLVTTKTVSMSAICLKATRSQSQIKSQRKEKKR
jgi:hypothetical protein